MKKEVGTHTHTQLIKSTPRTNKNHAHRCDSEIHCHVRALLAATDVITPDYEEPTDIDDYDSAGEIAETSFLY
jgi:hypothetical protein